MNSLEFTISVKRKRTKPVYITNTGDATQFVKGCFDKKIINWREQLIVVCISSDGKVGGWYKLSTGAADYCTIDIQSLLQVVILSNCKRFIIAHNHPSGSTNISAEDMAITKRIRTISKHIGLQLVDHFILAGNKLVRINK